MNKQKKITVPTRAKAQKIIAQTTDSEVIGQFLKHPNKHIVVYANRKLDQLRGGTGLAQIKTLVLVLSLVVGGDYSKVEEASKKLKRSEASKKSAATRKAKKAVEATTDEKAA